MFGISGERWAEIIFCVGGIIVSLLLFGRVGLWCLGEVFCIPFSMPLVCMGINALVNLYHDRQDIRQLQTQAHSITVEVSENGGYQVVE
ncbi:MAG: hypothetical protein JOZ57_18820 [Abitibacteriaceae bacterium]|nr:hypothetical protein [Abditibacteriaceae bacterium]